MKIFIFFLFTIFCSCKSKPVQTYVPPPIVETQPSWDGEEQNSGIIDYLDGRGFLITSSAAKRYTFLTGKFGQGLTPTVSPGEGLIPDGNNFLLSPEYMSVFMEVSRLNKQ
jgi:hypothetical protein